MMKDKALGYLGLAARGQRVVSGEFQVEEAVRHRTARLVIIARDASDNTKKHFRNMCAHAGIPCFERYDRETLGRCVGKDFRASAAFLDEGLAKAFRASCPDTEETDRPMEEQSSSDKRMEI